MSTPSPKVIEIVEYLPRDLPRAAIPYEVGHELWRRFAKQVEVKFPSPITDNCWRFESLGYVGQIPLSDDYHFVLAPKVPLANLFRMLEYAYRLKMHFLEGIHRSDSLLEFYERLARVLARRILDRARRGLYKAYIPRSARLEYIRGRMALRKVLEAPWQVGLSCNYQQHTTDVEENQILSWTALSIVRSGLCSRDTLQISRRAFRSLADRATLSPFKGSACTGRPYNRLNSDYEPMHALCRFFLDHSGPSHRRGDHSMLPFLINMASLYEMFAAQWLSANLPAGYLLKPKEKLKFTGPTEIRCEIDLLILDEATGTPLWVLDTKYKSPETPATDDIFQVVAYAEAVGCSEAILLYPVPLPRPIDTMFGRIRVRSATFALDGDLDESGRRFLERELRCEA